MSISQAMQIGISGLSANSSRVGNISNNIANANTDGYRRSFSQMVSSTTGEGPMSAGAGVRATGRADISTGGGLKSTGVGTDLGISGQGFFVVSRNPNETNAANYMLTRAGSFRPDENGNLVNAAGYYLAGNAYGEDGTLGAVDQNTFGDLQTVNVGNQTIQGQATTTMSIAANLPAQATGLEAGDPFVSSAEYYTPLGEAQRLQFSWKPGKDANTWEVTIADGEDDLGTIGIIFDGTKASPGTPSDYSLASVPGDRFVFDADTGIATLTMDDGAEPHEIKLSLGTPDSTDGITQFAGDFSGLSAEVDGTAAGSMVRSEITDSGDVYGIFDSGARKLLYSVPLATVTNPDGLSQADGNAFQLSSSSGPLELARAGESGAGAISAGALEGSNVEVAEELTDLIVAQRAYSSNAKIVTTSDQMLEETLSLKR
ncbi:flagellar hook protein [Roseivivax halodurans JCM 10272]|uniref:Flagellar hook protein FlgE n=1 Tax=Roseivivax halodurans JCM 10272 TaxID=1449350 RepID=X7EMC2_9RHOB|nr:flagellar hook-basal body complex protein [Roseivivax halodurans]ETX16316.1 flagellar hook protein [Roseivivax halodurans JCM 10272]